ncbi:hypothetical protein KP509_31G024100 [Ceratopteris richardii]|uniref:Uncharacterized protein n=1 Tax=Ceratopteris richardii TaxID=49495 RepID=A0A8T2QW95_CERRI|nr:hypothetical protein KP509_31G024100 [Ceratopteris richardii]
MPCLKNPLHESLHAMLLGCRNYLDGTVMANPPQTGGGSLWSFRTENGTLFVEDFLLSLSYKRTPERKYSGENFSHQRRGAQELNISVCL